MIVKVQRQLNEPRDTQIMVYNEDMSIFFIGPMTLQLHAWFKTYELKFYAEAELIGTVVHFKRKVRKQSW